MKVRKAISYKKSNRAYLWAIILMMVLPVPVTVIQRFYPGLSVSFLLLLVGDLYILSPVVAALTCKEKPNEILGFHKFRLSSAAWILLLEVLIYPICALLNLLIVSSGLNTGFDLDLSSMFQIFLTLCLLAPFCEEVLFRGVMFSGYKKSCSFLTAIILTSVCFGLLHANPRQLFYTMVGGFFFALVMQATGSLWASFLFHAVNNMCAIFVWPKLFDFLLPGSALTSDPGPATAGILIGLLVAALILTPAALLVIQRIAKGEGRENPLALLRGSCQKREEKSHFLSPALIISWLILILVMIESFLGV